jgi:hypothetical protein
LKWPFLVFALQHSQKDADQERRTGAIHNRCRGANQTPVTGIFALPVCTNRWSRCGCRQLVEVMRHLFTEL